MSQMDHTSILTRLVIAAEDAVLLRRCGNHDELRALEAQVIEEIRKPVDTVRVIDPKTRIFAGALTECDAALWRFDKGRAEIFARVLAVLLPDIRRDLSTAIEIRKRPTA